jgi:hypothetical protein
MDLSAISTGYIPGGPAVSTAEALVTRGSIDPFAPPSWGTSHQAISKNNDTVFRPFDESRRTAQ